METFVLYHKINSLAIVSCQLSQYFDIWSGTLIFLAAVCCWKEYSVGSWIKQCLLWNCSCSHCDWIACWICIHVLLNILLIFLLSVICLLRSFSTLRNTMSIQSGFVVVEKKIASMVASVNFLSIATLNFLIRPNIFLAVVWIQAVLKLMKVWKSQNPMFLVYLKRIGAWFQTVLNDCNYLLDCWFHRFKKNLVLILQIFFLLRMPCMD